MGRSTLASTVIGVVPSEMADEVNLCLKFSTVGFLNSR